MHTTHKLSFLHYSMHLYRALTVFVEDLVSPLLSPFPPVNSWQCNKSENQIQSFVSKSRRMQLENQTDMLTIFVIIKED